MKVTEFQIQGPRLIELTAYRDGRGFFVERFRQDRFAAEGFEGFVQENFSRSAPGVLRGLHFQYNRPQAKLITCLSGRIYDVAVDIRVGSPTFGQSIGVELDAEKPSWFYIPEGFAHGFCVLGDQEADLLYKVNNYYNAQGEGGILWNDPEINLKWPIQNPLISPRDEKLMTLAQYKEAAFFKYAKP